MDSSDSEVDEVTLIIPYGWARRRRSPAWTFSLRPFEPFYHRPSRTWTLSLRLFAGFYSLELRHESFDLDAGQAQEIRDYLQTAPFLLRVEREGNHTLFVQEVRTRTNHTTHPAVQILNSADPQWGHQYMDEIHLVASRFLRTINRRHRARQLSQTIDLPTNTPPPAHLVSPNLPGGPAACCICLAEYSEDSQITILNCHHTHHFHRDCLSEWLRRNNSCAYCKALVQ
ncbi:hypothetical protein PtB15_18B330 [Puccinia triticina]|nr:hypothetical protein PtB15_18B330 [Puccinia triticina]